MRLKVNRFIDIDNFWETVSFEGFPKMHTATFEEGRLTNHNSNLIKCSIDLTTDNAVISNMRELLNMANRDSISTVYGQHRAGEQLQRGRNGMGTGRKRLGCLESSSNIFLFLWMNLCLVVYIWFPDSPHIVPPRETVVDFNTEYIEDPRQLVDLHNFNYILGQSPCADHVQALIMVHTAPAYFEKRNIIRETWGSETVISANSSLRLLFLVGSVEDSQLQSSLLEEHKLHGDLLQGNFHDGYYNLTYKHVMALKWFHNHCGQAQLLVKVDDDVFLNTPRLLQDLRAPLDPPFSTLAHNPKELLLCVIKPKDLVARTYVSKWRVSFREYSDRYYPPFCPGFAVFYSSNVVKRLYPIAQRSNFFRLDDVFVTGFLTKRINITLTDLKTHVLYPERLDRLLNRNSGLEPFLVSWHRMSSQQMHGLWNLYGVTNTTNPAS